ncbi:MAG TPA: MTH938/NDUFAF3 family protein, partial [Afifellaceae bacterium]|nr:MTH938/NDUFAF3 family protein [Afifellaceae bacterium]
MPAAPDPTGRLEPARFPGRAPIDSYGNGGFRFADMSHRGSILSLPSGIQAWPATETATIGSEALAPILAEAAAIDVLLIGTGESFDTIAPEARQALQAAGLAPELMSTGAAVR